MRKSTLSCLEKKLRTLQSIDRGSEEPVAPADEDVSGEIRAALIDEGRGEPTMSGGVLNAATTPQ